MNPNESNLSPGPSLRELAETQLANSQPPEITARPSDELLHELRVHQIELEMQNEAMRQTQQALEESRDRFIDLYEFAPVGYVTLDPQGLIWEANLTGARLLGREKHRIIGLYAPDAAIVSPFDFREGRTVRTITPPSVVVMRG